MSKQPDFSSSDAPMPCLEEATEKKKPCPDGPSDRSSSPPCLSEEPSRLEGTTHGLSLLYYPAMESLIPLTNFRVIGGRLPEGTVKQFSPADHGMKVPEHMAKYSYSMEISSRTAPRDSKVVPEGFCINPAIDIYATERCEVERRATLTYRRRKGIIRDGGEFRALGFAHDFAGFGERYVDEGNVHLECAATISKEDDNMTIRLDCKDDLPFWLAIQCDMVKYWAIKK